VSVLPGAMVLDFGDGRQVRVPRDAIIAARPLTGSGPSPASGVTSARGSLLANAPGRAAAPGAGPAVSLPVNPESFYFTYINEKGSDVSAAWLLDLRTRLVKETGGPSPVLRAAIADALDAVARQLLENEFERHESAHGLACQAIAAGTAALDDAAGRDWVPPAYFRTLLRQLTYVVGTEHTRYLRDAVSSPDFVSLAARSTITWAMTRPSCSRCPCGCRPETRRSRASSWSWASPPGCGPWGRPGSSRRCAPVRPGNWCSGCGCPTWRWAWARRRSR